MLLINILFVQMILIYFIILFYRDQFETNAVKIKIFCVATFIAILANQIFVFNYYPFITQLVSFSAIFESASLRWFVSLFVFHDLSQNQQWWLKIEGAVLSTIFVALSLLLMIRNRLVKQEKIAHYPSIWVLYILLAFCALPIFLWMGNSAVYPLTTFESIIMVLQLALVIWIGVNYRQFIAHSDDVSYRLGFWGFIIALGVGISYLFALDLIFKLGYTLWFADQAQWNGYIHTALSNNYIFYNGIRVMTAILILLMSTRLYKMIKV